MANFQETLDANSLIVGREEAELQSSYLLDNGEGHLMTIAPTGAGKGVSCIIPNLLHYSGPAVVIDPKGEAYQVTAQHRRNMGQEVVLLDPFNETGEEVDTFNPLDIIRTGTDMAEDDVIALSNLLISFVYTKDPFWDISARNLCQGLLMHVAHNAPPALCNLGEISYLANQSPKEFEYTFKEMQRAAQSFVKKKGVAAAGTEPKVISSIISVLQSHLECLNSRQVQAAIKKTSFDLKSFYLGKAQTIYIVIPPEKLQSHGSFLRLWVGSLLSLLMRRKAAPEQKTLFLIDEAAQLGHMRALCKITTLLRGYGVRLWTFWQDLDQLKDLYPTDWKVLVNNCSSLQMCGFNNMMAAKVVKYVLGKFSGSKLMELSETEQVLLKAKRNPIITQKTVYLDEEYYQSKYQENHRYSNKLTNSDAESALGILGEGEKETSSQVSQLLETLRETTKIEGKSDFHFFCHEVERLIREKLEQVGSLKHQKTTSDNPSNVIPMKRGTTQKELERMLIELDVVQKNS